MPGRFSALMLIVLSLTVSCRYIWWRYTSTLNWDDPVSLVCGLILLFAETYAWIVLVLGYFQVVWPLNRQPVPLPKDMSLWPSVDIFVPTYNEDLNVVKNTIYASQGIDWPKDKLTIWILDDGGREEFRQFAQNVGVKYIARTTSSHRTRLNATWGVSVKRRTKARCSMVWCRMATICGTPLSSAVPVR